MEGFNREERGRGIYQEEKYFYLAKPMIPAYTPTHPTNHYTTYLVACIGGLGKRQNILGFGIGFGGGGFWIIVLGFDSWCVDSGDSPPGTYNSIPLSSGVMLSPMASVGGTHYVHQMQELK